MTQPERSTQLYEDFIPLADVSHIHRKWLDLEYANLSPSHKLDIYLPDEGDGLFPVILYLHGGAFSIGDKRDIYVLNILKSIKRGYAVVSVNYRLSGEAIFPAGIQDVKAAIRWIRANCKKYNLDGNRIGVWGCSSGANYAAMICLTDRVAEFDDLNLGNPEYTCNVQAAVEWFGPTDFLKMDEQARENGFGLTDHGEADSPESSFAHRPEKRKPVRGAGAPHCKGRTVSCPFQPLPQGMKSVTMMVYYTKERGNGQKVFFRNYSKKRFAWEAFFVVS